MGLAISPVPALGDSVTIAGETVPLPAGHASAPTGDTAVQTDNGLEPSPTQPKAAAPAPPPLESDLSFSSPLGSELLISQDQAEGEQAGALAKSSSPQAVQLREESRTKFEDLGALQAAEVAREAFPEVIEQQAGGPPSLPAGQQVVGYFRLPTQRNWRFPAASTPSSNRRSRWRWKPPLGTVSRSISA